ncbi:aldo/keto reductase [Paenibacillus terreus]|uniref:Aldo/keto reductase n=1 Tax=Paenibacillus terreus TaxID=1387834 RepID=A0ABV5B6N5_9BACL
MSFTSAEDSKDIRLKNTVQFLRNSLNTTSKALHPIRDKVTISTKFRVYKENGNVEKQVEKAIDGALKRLNTEYIDLFYLHRINPEIPVEEVVFGIGKMIESGKIKGWGLSQVSEDEIRLANNVTQLILKSWGIRDRIQPRSTCIYKFGVCE